MSDEFLEPAAPACLPPGERTGQGTAQLFQLIDTDEQRRNRDEDSTVPLAPSVPGVDTAAIAAISDNQPFEDWIRAHRELMALETSFNSLAMRAVAGEVSTQELSHARSCLEGMRALCSEAYARAFPGIQ
jgi:hypothetical protein